MLDVTQESLGEFLRSLLHTKPDVLIITSPGPKTSESTMSMEQRPAPKVNLKEAIL